MDVAVEEKSPVAKLVTITLEETEIEKDMAKRLQRLGKRVKIHGFRPGKAPAKLLRKKYGQSVRAEAIDDAIRRSIDEALETDDLKGTIHISRPDLKSGIADGEAIVFEFTAERFPEFDAKDYEGVDVQLLDVKVSDEDIASELERMQEEQTAIVPVEDRDVVEATDIVIVSYKGVGEGEVSEIAAEDQQIDLADEALLAGFADAVAGAKVGEAVEAEVQLPEEFGLESIAGQKITLSVTVSEIKKREVPELDDDFAGDVGDFETLDALKEDIRTRLLTNREKGAETDARRRLIDAVVANNPIELPELYVKTRAAEEAQMRLRQLAQQGLDLNMLGDGIQEWAASMEGEVSGAIHESIVLRNIGAAHEIEVSEDDIEAHLAEEAEATGQPLARLKARFAVPEQRDGLRSRLTYERVVDHIWSKAKVEKVDALPEPEPAEADEAEEAATESDDA